MTSSNNGGTRESNDNNPLGVTGNGNEFYPGIVGTDPPLLQFDNDFDGVNAAAYILWQYFTRDGVNTVDGIGNRWSGNAADYAANLAGFTGLKPGVPLNYWKDGVNLMNGISKCENGGGFQVPWTLLALGLVMGPTYVSLSGGK